jgi:hypothetical protein
MRPRARRRAPGGSRSRAARGGPSQQEAGTFAQEIRVPSAPKARAGTTARLPSRPRGRRAERPALRPETGQSRGDRRHLACCSKRRGPRPSDHRQVVHAAQVGTLELRTSGIHCVSLGSKACGITPAAVYGAPSREIGRPGTRDLHSGSARAHRRGRRRPPPGTVVVGTGARPSAGRTPAISSAGDGVVGALQLAAPRWDSASAPARGAERTRRGVDSRASARLKLLLCISVSQMTASRSDRGRGGVPGTARTTERSPSSRRGHRQHRDGSEARRAGQGRIAYWMSCFMSSISVPFGRAPGSVLRSRRIGRSRASGSPADVLRGPSSPSLRRSASTRSSLAARRRQMRRQHSDRPARTSVESRQSRGPSNGRTSEETGRDTGRAGGATGQRRSQRERCRASPGRVASGAAFVAPSATRTPISIVRWPTAEAITQSTGRCSRAEESAAKPARNIRKTAAARPIADDVLERAEPRHGRSGSPRRSAPTAPARGSPGLHYDGELGTGGLLERP